MSKNMKTIMAFLTAMTMTAGAMGVTAYAEEASTAAVTETSSNLVYEVDDPAYKAQIDSLYDYVPLEELVLKCLNKFVDNKALNDATYENKWYYKHVYTGTPEFNIEAQDDVIAESIRITTEQGKADDIEERDGKVRKFNIISICWSILLSDTPLELDEINTFLTESGFKASMLKTTENAKQFALHFDKGFTTETVINTLSALNEKFGLFPGAIANEVGTYDLYYDSAYKGDMSERTWTAPIADDDPYKGDGWIQRKTYFAHDGKLESGVEYHYNPETRGILIDGDGVFTCADGSDIIYNFHPKFYIIGKSVKLDNTLETGEKLEFNFWLDGRLYKKNCDVYAYHNSDAENKYKEIINDCVINAKDYRFDGYSYPCTDIAELESIYPIKYLDDTVDPYEVLNGKVDITAIKQPVEVEEEKTVADESETVSEAEAKEYTDVKVMTEKSTATLKGDADLNGEVSLTDVVVVSKNTLSDEAYPLKNEIAFANADMNDDTKVNAVDTSALIEDQLGKK